MISKILKVRDFNKILIQILFTIFLYFLYLNSIILNLKILFFLVVSSLFFTFNFLTKKYNLIYLSLNFFFLIYVSLSFYNKINLTLLTLTVFFIFCYFETNDVNDQIKLKMVDIEKRLVEYLSSKTKILLIFLFLITFFSQNDILNYETTDWDIHSYLVSSLEIGKGNLPYENQWESKGPVLYYVYYLLILLSNSNLVIFKLFCDFIIFIISLNIFFISKNRFGNILNSFFASLTFILFMSFDWASIEYSEIFVLLFLSYCYLFLSNQNEKKYLIFLSGLFLSISTLINQGSGLFIVPLIFCLLVRQKKVNILSKENTFFVFGLVVPHLIFLLIYLFNDLFDVYIATLFKIPLSYTETEFQFIKEFLVFIRSIYEREPLLYVLLFMVLIALLKKLYEDLIDKEKKFIFTFEMSIIISFLISIFLFFIAAKGYYHHLIFFLFFTSCLIIFIKNKKHNFVIYSLILLSLMNISFHSFGKSYINLVDIKNTYESYPLKQLSNQIKEEMNDSFTIFALDHVLLLYYLDIKNLSYIIHPSNHFEPFINQHLIPIGKVQNNNVDKLLTSEPDLVVCSLQKIENGSPVKNKDFNCDMTQISSKYIKLDTTEFNDNPNLRLYRDPYREIDLYLKIEK